MPRYLLCSFRAFINISSSIALSLAVVACDGSSRNQPDSISEGVDSSTLPDSGESEESEPSSTLEDSEPPILSDPGETEESEPALEPLEARGNLIALRARSRFEFSPDSLIESLTIDGQQALRSPIILTLSIDEDSYSLPGDFELVANSEDSDRINIQSIEERPGYTLNTELGLDDDGFLLVTINIEPTNDGDFTIKELLLTMSLTDLLGSNLSRYLPYDFESQRFDSSSIDELSVQLAVGQTIEYPFSHVMAVESDSHGIEWMTETDSWHSIHDETASIHAARSANGVDLEIRLVDKPITSNKSVFYEFSLFPIPARYQTNSQNKTVIGTASTVGNFLTNYGSYTNFDPVYFANWSRLPFQIPGLPNIAISERDKVNAELQLLEDAGIGYMPYTAMHLLSSDVVELNSYYQFWAADESRASNWLSESSQSGRIQPVAFDHSSLASFFIAKHVQAVQENQVSIMYHDVATANRVEFTRQKAILERNLESTASFTPLFGQRQYVIEYKDAMLTHSPKTRIAFHTGSYLPKSISTYADFVIFGESFHNSFKALAEDVPSSEYVPDYFSLPEALTKGLYSQKNGFRYILIPQLKRAADGILPDENTLDAQTRELISFAFIHDFGIWGTKLSSSVFHEHLDVIDELYSTDIDTEIRIDIAAEDWTAGSDLSGKLIESESASVLALYNHGPDRIPVNAISEAYPSLTNTLNEFAQSCQPYLEARSATMCTR